jgi:hypothetical protein
MIGLGMDEPAADNHTRDGRKQNRRVEVRLMTPPGEQAANTLPGNESQGAQ